MPDRLGPYPPLKTYGARDASLPSSLATADGEDIPVADGSRFNANAARREAFREK